MTESANSSETYQRYYRIFQHDWSPYVRANNRYAQSEKLVAYHTRDCAEQTERTANYALLTVYHIREGLR